MIELVHLGSSSILPFNLGHSVYLKSWTVVAQPAHSRDPGIPHHLQFPLSIPHGILNPQSVRPVDGSGVSEVFV